MNEIHESPRPRERCRDADTPPALREIGGHRYSALGAAPFLDFSSAAPQSLVRGGEDGEGEVDGLAALSQGPDESIDPAFVPMTDVRTRSLADRRVIARYDFALVNRRHIVAATEAPQGMIREQNVL